MKKEIPLLNQEILILLCHTPIDIRLVKKNACEKWQPAIDKLLAKGIKEIYAKDALLIPYISTHEAKIALYWLINTFMHCPKNTEMYIRIIFNRYMDLNGCYTLRDRKRELNRIIKDLKIGINLDAL